MNTFPKFSQFLNNRAISEAASENPEWASKAAAIAKTAENFLAKNNVKNTKFLSRGSQLLFSIKISNSSYSDKEIQLTFKEDKFSPNQLSGFFVTSCSFEENQTSDAVNYFSLLFALYKDLEMGGEFSSAVNSVLQGS
jgi:hypothetical protein